MGGMIGRHRFAVPALRRCLWLVLSLVCAPLVGAAADAPPTAPILRIETGMDVAAINDIAADEPDQQLVTVSDDKTTRIWSMANGELVGTLRGPIGDGPEGGLYAVALSPSGKTIAVGGYTGVSWDNATSIYLFNRKDGSWLGRIALGAGTDAINHLAFSPNGRYLAVGTSDGRGLRVLDIQKSSVSIVDSDYADAIEWLDFASDGRLVTSSLDGGVRLYDSAFKRLALYRLPQGEKPFAVAFSKDGGSKVAVGLLNEAVITVLSGRDLKPAGERKGTSGQHGALSIVAWSADSRFIYGAGTYSDTNGHKLVRKWSIANPDASGEFAVTDDTITALAPLKDGRIAYASAGPAWGMLSATDAVTFHHDRVQADFRDGDFAFKVSNNGAVVEFGFAQGGKNRARFDVTAGTLAMDPPARDDLKPPSVGAGDTGLADWRNSDKPKLGGRTLPLDANERARSGAVNGDWAVLGTDYFLRAYHGGQPAWRTAVPAPVWVANISGDGRLAVAGLGDGTIRWYRLADGAEMLSLFAEADGKHWVLWTPEGFFDHGDGGQNLIGYHLNQVDQGRPKGASFVNVEQLYKLFFRRDLVVKKFLGGHDDEIASELQRIGNVRTVLGRGLPPDITLTEYCVKDGGAQHCTPLRPQEQLRGAAGKLEPVTVTSPEVELHFELKNEAGGFGPIVVRNRGAAIDAPGETRSAKADIHAEARTVKLQPGLNIIALSAFNATKEIETDQKDRPFLALRYDAPTVPKRVLRLLAIGIDKFKSKDIPTLANAAADAKSVADIMKGDGKQDIFASVDAIVLTDANATQANIAKAFADLAGRTSPDDLTFVFLAGHGVGFEGKYYYLPTDLPDTSEESIRKHALSSDDLAEDLSKFPTSRALIVLDTCYAGAFATDDNILRDSRDQTLGKQISHATGRFILAGSSSQQEALDGVDGHGVFTEVLLRGLKGDADAQVAGNHDGKVSIFELGEYTKSQVPALAAKIAQGYNQKPRWYFNGDEMFDLRDATN